MRVFSRFLSVASLLALMSAPVLRAQDDQPYDPQSDNEVAQPAPDSAPNYDQQPSSPQADANSDYDGRSTTQRPETDPPARAARLQYMNGSVSVQPQGTGDWVTGELNRPLTDSDNIWADKNSRAEINVGTGLARIDSETSLTLTNVSQNAVQLQLHQGALNLHVRRLYDNEVYEVDTPNQAFTVQKPGDYRFDVDSDADKTVITVWRGEGESTGSGPSVRIRANQQARFTNGTSMTNDIHGAPRLDAFDEWARSRDERGDHSASARYVSPDVVGYEDLDEYGTWKETPDYGAVWTPAVAPGWSPYYNGRWIWESPWGWTWVEAEPWGYAPFHYGRWVYASGYWGWAPGPIWVRPYYAPALVAWFGGPSWGVNFGFGFGGGFGWCPLGFGEPFIPWYGVSRGYFRNVNISNTRITNITTINNIYNNNYINNHGGRGGRPVGGPYGPHSGSQIRYANMHAPNGFTAASRNTLVNSLPVSRNSVRVAPNQLSRVGTASVRVPQVRPTRATIAGGAGRASAAPARSFSRPVMSHITPATVNRNGVAGVGRTPMTGRGNIERPQIGANRSISQPNQNGVRTPENVARMPQRGASPNPGSGIRTPSGPGGLGSRSVPRPPTAGGIGTARAPMSGARPDMSARSTAPQMRPQSAPPPSTPGMARGGAPMASPRSTMPSGGGRSAPAPRANGNGPRSEMTVPRPNSSAPQGYSSARDRGSFPTAGGQRASAPRPSPSYQADNRPAPSYRPAPNYGGASSRPMPSNRGSYGSPAPTYGRSAPSYSGPAYSRSMPSYGGSRSADPSYGGGGGRAPSYSAPRAGGGFGGRPSGGFGGGGRSSGGGGGGGHVSSGGGGGGHVSSGGGGGSHGGNTHGGRH